MDQASDKQLRNQDANHRVALVTGAARRLGAAIAEHLHGAGFDVVIHCRRSRQAAQAVADRLNDQRADSAWVEVADLGDVAACRELVSAAVARRGRLDLLVNNASDFYPTPVGRIESGDWDALFAANARGPLFLSQAAAIPLREVGGSIINIVDVHGERPLLNHTVYCMAKAALAMMTRSLALELGPEVRVNGVAPGAILWPEPPISEDEQHATLARTALKRCGEPEDIAGAVRFLAIDSRYVTGQILAVDGGRSLNI